MFDSKYKNETLDTLQSLLACLEQASACQHEVGHKQLEVLTQIKAELQQINITTQQENGRLARIERWMLEHAPGYPQLPPDAAEGERMARNGVEPIPLTTTDRRSA